jgi:DNA ligase-1
MHGLTRRHLAFSAGLCCLPGWGLAQSRPLMLASAWRPGLAVTEYWVSEKLDGIRAFWDGDRLWTRGGHPIPAPQWFTQGWPDHALDGELWGGRQGFEQVISTARQSQPDDAAWRRLRLMVFDLPDHGGVFSQRYLASLRLLDRCAVPWLHAVAQERLSTEAEIQGRLQQVVRQGGEGLMLHHAQALYQGQRSAELLKFKPVDDADARVLEHLPGQGRLAGKVGALLVEIEEPPQGRRFKLGSGLSEQLRTAPPPVGTVVSFRHRGFTADGLPRHATFWRVRPEE